MFQKIIVAVDLAQVEKGKAIIRRAENMIDRGGEIILVNVVEELPNYLAIDVTDDILLRLREEAQDQMLGLLRASAGASRVVIRTGPPAREILALADEIKADLIIIASHVPDVTNYFIGATADRIVRHANCSVLIERH